MNGKDKNKSGGIFGGRGFYIALFMCVALVGVYAWALLFEKDEKDKNASNVGYTLAAMDENQNEEAVSVGSFGTSYIINGEDENSPKGENSGDYQNKDEAHPTSAGMDDAGEIVAVSAPTETEPDFFVWPVSGELSREYSVETLSYDVTMSDWRTHAAIDISAVMGSKVYAVADGTVERIYTDDLMGTTVVVSHSGGLKSIYSNLGGMPTVNEGDKITAGTVIGCVSDTAIGEISQTSHLHFAMQKDDAMINPASYLPEK